MIKYLEEVDLKCFDLIIPSVSVGNVGQLSIDLLLNSLPVTKLGFFWHRNILPVVTYDKNSKVTTACELYICKDLSIIIVQNRSTYGKFETIKSDLKDLCRAVKQVFILTGGFAYERKDIHMISEPIRILATNVLELLPQSWKFIKENWKRGDLLQIPGSGIADKLFSLCDEECIPALLIAEFISEGDNRQDAHEMCNFLDSWLKLRSRSGIKEDSWTIPHSWDTVYGRPHPNGLF